MESSIDIKMWFLDKTKYFEESEAATDESFVKRYLITVR